MKFNNTYRIGKNVVIGKNVKIGDDTVIYDNVTIDDDTIIANNCIIGEPLHDYYLNKAYKNPPTRIGAHSLIKSHSIIYASSVFGEYFQTGHRVLIREKTIMGDHCMVGSYSDIEGYTTFGRYCRLHSNVHIGQKSKIGNFVFIYPYVIFTNDPTPPSNICIGPTVGDYSQIAAGSIVMPGIIIGSNCLIGSGSIVTKNVADYTLAYGSPAKNMCDVRKIKSKEKNGNKPYPWMYNFTKRMPWEKIGYKKWIKLG